MKNNCSLVKAPWSRTSQVFRILVFLMIHLPSTTKAAILIDLIPPHFTFLKASSRVPIYWYGHTMQSLLSADMCFYNSELLSNLKIESMIIVSLQEWTIWHDTLYKNEPFDVLLSTYRCNVSKNKKGHLGILLLKSNRTQHERIIINNCEEEGKMGASGR